MSPAEPVEPQAQSAGPRRVFLAQPPDERALAAGGCRAELLDADRTHALRVLRVRPGDRLEGLDGVGAAWPLVVESATRRELEVRVVGPPERAPRAGDPGSPLPFVECAVAWPKAGRGDAMLNALAQLGAAAVRPLACQRGSRGSGDALGERAVRIAREAAKQCGRRWLPELRAPRAPAALLAGRTIDAALLDPRAERSLVEWALASERPTGCVLAIGPEGGLTPGERDALIAAGAVPVRIGGHVLRIETAAAAACAIVVSAHEAPRAPR